MKFELLLLFSLMIGLQVGTQPAKAGENPGSSEVFYENASGTPLLGFLKSATQSIDIEIYEMDDLLVHSGWKSSRGSL